MRDRSDPVVFAKLWARLAAQPEVKILLLGLDSAGKSTILYKITTGEVVATAPTVGSNVEVRLGIQRTMWSHGYNPRTC
jgi:GTPase SAR1 family protein